MARVFISHANKDHEYARQLHRWLIAEGHEVFLDQDLRDGIRVGEEWNKRLHERLRWADAVVCVVTSATVASTWCTAEISIALSRGSRLLPVLAEPGVDHPLLTSAQYADLTVDPTTGREALVTALRRVDAVGGLGWPDDRSPFPGLRPFDLERHRVFFGRNREVEQLAGLLRSPAERVEGAILLVAGPSGCGKSSLVRAGLVPRMADETGWWMLPPMLPGTDPVAGLVRELAAAGQQSGLDWTVADLRQRLDDGDLTGLANELLVTTRTRRLLLVVDQLEELLTQTAPAERAQFAQLLRPALSSPVQVVATLRLEFLDQLLVDSDLAVLTTRTYTLRPLRREALRAVIEGPTQLAGIGIEDELVARMVADTDNGEALPLLAFTLAQLADGIGRGGQLSRQRYEQLGGVQGALTRQAEEALADASAATGRSREEVIAGLLRLVTVDEQGRPTRWRIPREELPTLVTRELDVFVERRLLTVDIDNTRVVLGVAHESFLSTWPPLNQAITAATSALRARRQVQQAAVEWADDGHPADRLWEGGRLAAAIADTGAHLQSRDLITDRVDLTPAARTFLLACIRRDRFRRRRTITALSVLLALALLAAVVAVTQQRTAEGQRNVAVSRQVAAEALTLRGPNPALAAQLDLAAYRLVPAPEARGSLLSILANPYAARLTGHTNTIGSVAFSPDGHTLATASSDNTARLWDVSDSYHPRPLATLTGQTDSLGLVAFSPDGHILATANSDNTARLWDVSDLRHPRPMGTLIGHTSSVESVTFSSDGHILATSSRDETVRLWDVSDPSHPHLLSTLTGHTNTIRTVVFSPGERTLATASFDNTARLWDVSDPSHPHLLSTLTGHTNAVWSVAFSLDGHTLATGSADDTARLWDVTDPSHPHLLSTLTGHAKAVFSVAFSPDGHTLATGSADDTAGLWEISDLRRPNPLCLCTLIGHTSGVYSVAFSPDGSTLATAGSDHTARLWDLPGPIMAGHASGIESVAFSPDGSNLATGSDDSTARLWEVSDPFHPRPLGTLTGHTNALWTVAFSPDGHTLATGSADSTARLWEVSDPSHPRPLSTLTGHTNGVYSVAFSPNGHTLATGSLDSTARLWEVSDPSHPRPLSTLPGHTNGVRSVAFSPDGHTLATGSADNTARLWEVSDPSHPRPLSTLTGHTSSVYSVAFSPDGHTLATGSADKNVRLWDVSDARHLRPLGILTGHTNAVYALAFSPDGHALATGSYDKTARLWDVSDPRHLRPLGTLTGHTNSVFAVAFSPDGHALATGSYDKTARLWETNVDSVAARICSITWPAITKSEWDQYLPGLPYRSPCP